MREQFVNVGTVRLWSCSSGSGYPVLLCSGGPGCCDYLAPVAALLGDEVQPIRFDYRGCGRSDAATTYSIESCLEDMEAIRRHYQIDRWIVAGHSAGADMTLAYAMQYPERVQGFVCLAGGRVHNDREWHRIYSEKRDQGLEVVPEFDYPYNAEVNRQVNRDWKVFIQRPTLLKEIASIQPPALFVYGTEDIRPSWPIEQVAHLIPGAQLKLIAGADHHLWQTHADVLKEALQGFVHEVVSS